MKEKGSCFLVEWEIRKAQPEEINQIQDVARTSWNTTYEGVIPEKIQENFLNNAYSSINLIKRIESTLFLIAKVNERVVGFANFSDSGSENQVELTAIYLHPAYQHLGIGSALLETGLNMLGTAKKVYVDVEKENHIGRNFYQKKGFKIVEEFDDVFEGHALKTVRMIANLDK